MPARPLSWPLHHQHVPAGLPTRPLSRARTAVPAPARVLTDDHDPPPGARPHHPLSVPSLSTLRAPLPSSHSGPGRRRNIYRAGA